MIEPSAVYDELLRGAPRAPGRAYRSFVAPAGVALQAFIDGQTRLPGLSIQVPREDVPASMHLPNMKGAKTEIRADGDGTARDVVYEVSASDAAYSSVFMELASRLIAEAARASDAKKALLGVARRLAAWARFFDARGTDSLGRTAQLGLIGELLCLREVGQSAGLARAVRAWVGPLGGIHDFVSPAGAIEAKLSTSSAPERFRITSERQLDESTVSELLLCAITCQESAAAELGLASIANELRKEIEASAPADLAAFEDRLLQAGFADQDCPKYDVRVALRGLEFVHVHDQFPRITPAELRTGVFSVNYEIPRSAIVPFKVPNTRAGEIISAVE